MMHANDLKAMPAQSVPFGHLVVIRGAKLAPPTLDPMFAVVVCDPVLEQLAKGGHPVPRAFLCLTPKLPPFLAAGSPETECIDLGAPVLIVPSNADTFGWDKGLARPGNLTISVKGPAIISSDARSDATQSEEYVDIKSGRFLVGNERMANWYAQRWELGIVGKQETLQTLYSWDSKPRHLAHGTA